MRTDRVPYILERGRIRHGEWASTEAEGYNGAFQIVTPNGNVLRIIANTAELAQARGWEHVSVSLADRTPTWEEMCFVKGLFWTEDELVVQLHPPKSRYINKHPHCLHLWRNVKQVIILPPLHMV